MMTAPDQTQMLPKIPADLGGRLTGRTILIFGGTSGIGLATAIQAKAVGARVIVLGIDADRAAQAASDNGLAGWRVADVTRREQIEAAVADIDHVDHLVFLAGTLTLGKVMEADIDTLRRPFEERIWGAVHAIRALGDRLAQDGSITFSSGTLSDRPNAFGTALLAATGAAVEALARALALELAPRRVNTLSPGPLDTGLRTKAMGQEADDAYVKHLNSILPGGRIGTAQEAGAAVVFLMANRFMNAATLNLDGASRLV